MFRQLRKGLVKFALGRTTEIIDFLGSYLANTENDCDEPHSQSCEVTWPLWFRPNDHNSLFGLQILQSTAGLWLC